MYEERHIPNSEDVPFLRYEEKLMLIILRCPERKVSIYISG